MRRFEAHYGARDLPTEGRRVDLHGSLRTVQIAPMTTNVHEYPWRVPITFQKKSGMVALDQVRTVDKKRFVRRIGRASRAVVEGIKLGAGERQRVSLSRHVPQHRVRKASGALLSREPDEFHALVHGRRDWHSAEMNDLVCAQAQDGEHFDVDVARRTPGEPLDQVIELRAPAKRADGDFGQQGLVARVLNVVAGPGNRSGKIDGAALDVSRAEGRVFLPNAAQSLAGGIQREDHVLYL